MAGLAHIQVGDEIECVRVFLFNMEGGLQRHQIRRIEDGKAWIGDTTYLDLTTGYVRPGRLDFVRRFKRVL